MMSKQRGDLDRILARLTAAGLSRREAIAWLAAAGISGAGIALSGGRAFAADELTGPGGIPLARPDKPVTLPRHQDSIKTGLKPETGGTFRLFNYADYLDKKVMDDFGKKYGVSVELTSFDSMDQAITRLASKGVQPDVTNITPDRIAQAVAGKL